MIEPYYDKNGVTLYHGDCLQILPALGLNPAKVALISDPPYGINADFKRTGMRRRTKALDWVGDATRNWEDIENDDKPFDPAHLLGFSIVALFGANHFADKLPAQEVNKPWKWLLWDKRRDSPADDNSDGELIWTNRTGALRIHRQLWRGLVREGEENISRAPKLHQMQKPIRLMRWVIGECKVPAGYTVVDPYFGSGTTLRAAKDLGYQAIGIELKRENCDIAIERLRQQAFNFAEAA